MLRRNRTVERRRRLAAAFCATMQVLGAHKKRAWVHPVNERRDKLGEFATFWKEIKAEDGDRFFKYTRMKRSNFESLLKLVEGELTRFGPRQICPEQRLAMTLKYLSTGSQMQTVAWSFRVGNSTMSGIVRETCQAISDALWNTVVRCPQSPNEWLQIEVGFSNRWQLPHCIGAIDGKHIVIQAPKNAGSSYFNYKKDHSIVLLAVADASYRFRYANIGAYGGRSDAGTFRDTPLCRRLNDKTLGVPVPSKLDANSDIQMPYFLVGDEAFPLREFLMRPFSGRSTGRMPFQEEIFNYRLSRARRVVESSFGILASRWRIFRRPIIATVETVESIVKATVCLHNYLMMSEEERSGQAIYRPPSRLHSEFNDEALRECLRVYREETSGFAEVNRLGSNNFTQQAGQLRNDLAEYLCSDNAVPWQVDRINQIFNQ